MPVEIFLIIGLIIVAAALFSLRYKSVNHDLPYEAQKYLLTPAEKLFFATLTPAVNGRYTVFAKVRIGDVLKVVSGVAARRSLIARAKIQQKHFDFVLCNKSMEIVCCIELNDRSHARSDRIKRDKFVRAACHQAGVSLIEFQAQSSYDVKTVERRLLEVLEVNGRVQT